MWGGAGGWWVVGEASGGGGVGEVGVRGTRCVGGGRCVWGVGKGGGQVGPTPHSDRRGARNTAETVPLLPYLPLHPYLPPPHPHLQSAIVCSGPSSSARTTSSWPRSAARTRASASTLARLAGLLAALRPSGQAALLGVDASCLPASGASLDRIRRTTSACMHAGVGGWGMWGGCRWVGG